MIDLAKVKAARDAEAAHARSQWHTKHMAMHAEYTSLHAQFVQMVKADRAAAYASPTRKRMNLLRALGRKSSAERRAVCNARRSEVAKVVAAVLAEDAPALVARTRGKGRGQISAIDEAELNARSAQALDAIAQSLREGLPQLDKEAWRRKPVRAQA